jgi:hypothetical protein
MLSPHFWQFNMAIAKCQSQSKPTYEIKFHHRNQILLFPYLIMLKGLFLWANYKTSGPTGKAVSLYSGGQRFRSDAADCQPIGCLV